MIKMEFNKDGSLKLPEEIIDAREKLKEKIVKARNNSDKLLVKYDQISDYEDNWLIILPKDIPSEILFKLKKWTDVQHKITGGNSLLKIQSKNEFNLIIEGYGNKCTWAHSFFNGLNTALIKDYGTKIEQIGTCKHKFYVKDIFDII